MISNFSALILMATALVACSPQRHITTHDSSSTRVEIVERIVTLRDTVTICIPSNRDSVTVVTDSVSILENSVARSRAQIVSGRLLSHTLESIPQQIIRPVEFETKLRDSIIYHEKITQHTIEVERELTHWQQMQIRGFWIIAFALLTVIILRR